MIAAADIEAIIVQGLPDAVVALEDLTGTQDHWRARVVSASFEGMRPLARHRLIYKLLAVQLEGPIHALALETLTPKQAASNDA